MGDNIHQLTSLPYANFDDEHSEGEDHGHSHGEHGHGHAHDHSPTIQSMNVDQVTSQGRKPKLKEKFHSMTKEKKITLILAVFLVTLSVVSIVYASIEKSQRPFKEHLKKCMSLEKNTRIDAGFGVASSKSHCLKWGGCWDGSAVGSPSCYYPFSNYRGYRVSNSTKQLWGMEIDLERIETLDKIFTSEADQLKCVISYETDSRLRVKIFDPNSPNRYEVPMSSAHAVTGHRMQYILTVTEDLFGFAVSRTHEATSTIFNTTMEGLIFSDQFLQLNMRLSSSNVYGLSGDHKDGLLRKMEFSYQSLWSTSVEKRHGAHPLLLHVEKDGHASGFFLQNSDPMDVILNPHPAITFRSTGGILDFYIFLGPTPADVITQFTHKIGNPFLPPLWALGYHFGSDNFQNTKDFDMNTILEMPFPLDGIWAGKSLLKDNEEFSTDSDRFQGIDQMISSLHSSNKWFLVDTRPAILTSSSLYSNEDAHFVRDHTNKTLIAQTEAGDVVVLDYFHPDTNSWLQNALSQHRSALPFDGLSLDENEPSTLSNGSVSGCSDNKLDNSVYDLHNMPKLKIRTVCPSAQHYGGLNHYDVHNIYGWKSSEITHRALSEVIPDKRSLLLSRSSYLGSGVVSGHFVKENTATWEDMKHSIIVMLNYNMYGMPFVGANVCGYRSDPDATKAAAEQLCVRWHQLAVFYPFTKRFPSKDTELLAFTAESLSQIRSAMELRYRMLPNLYTLFYNAHTKGLPVVRPLFFNYLTDSKTLSIESQFMFGEGVMVAPVLKPDVTEHSVYFPDDTWYDYLNPSNVVSTAGYINQTVSMDRQTYFVRGGHVLVSHLTTANNTKDINEKGDYVLDVYLSSEGIAFGELYTDDGTSLDTISHAEFLYVTFNATNEHIRSEVTLRYPGHENSNKIQQLNIRGLKQEPTKVLVKDAVEKTFEYKEGVLSVTSLELPVVEAFMLSYS